MKIYTFVSTKDNTLRGLTHDNTGSNLPVASAPWTLINTANSDEIQNHVMEAIQKGGYYLSDDAVKITRVTSPQV